MPDSTPRTQVAIFVDGVRCGGWLADGGARALVEQAAELGATVRRLTVGARAAAAPELVSAGFESVAADGAPDVRIAVEALELAARAPALGWVLLAGDLRSLRPLCRSLRARGIRVFGFAARSVASEAARFDCDRFRYVLTDGSGDADRRLAAQRRLTDAWDAEVELRRIMARLGDAETSLDQIEARLRAIEPAFDAPGGFLRFVERLSDVIEVVRGETGARFARPRTSIGELDAGPLDVIGRQLISSGTTYVSPRIAVDVYGVAAGCGDGAVTDEALHGAIWSLLGETYTGTELERALAWLDRAGVAVATADGCWRVAANRSTEDVARGLDGALRAAVHGVDDDAVIGPLLTGDVGEFAVAGGSETHVFDVADDAQIRGRSTAERVLVRPEDNAEQDDDELVDASNFASIGVVGEAIGGFAGDGGDEREEGGDYPDSDGAAHGLDSPTALVDIPDLDDLEARAPMDDDEARSLLERALDALGGHSVPGELIRAKMVELDRRFDEETLGYLDFKVFVESAGAGLVVDDDGDGRWSARHPVPESPSVAGEPDEPDEPDEPSPEMLEACQRALKRKGWPVDGPGQAIDTWRELAHGELVAPFSLPDAARAARGRLGSKMTATNIRRALGVLVKAKVLAWVDSTEDGTARWHLADELGEDAVRDRVDAATVAQLLIVSKDGELPFSLAAAAAFMTGPTDAVRLQSVERAATALVD